MTAENPCDHDSRFGGVMGLPSDCHGCLACMVQRQAITITEIIEHTETANEAFRRFLMMMANAMPMLDQHIAELLGEWNRIRNEIKSEYAAVAVESGELSSESES